MPVFSVSNGSTETGTSVYDGVGVWERTTADWPALTATHIFEPTGSTWSTSATFRVSVVSSVIATDCTNGTATNSTITFVVPRPIVQLPEPVHLNHLGRHARAVGRAKEFEDVDAAEIAALQLLRRMVSPDDFRRYLRYGFVVAEGPSGLSYQIDRRRHERILVRKRGERLAYLCVHLKDAGMPPTDEVVAKKLIAECDEAGLWRRSNVTWVVQGDARARWANEVGVAA